MFLPSEIQQFLKFKKQKRECDEKEEKRRENFEYRLRSECVLFNM
jgi:hypothetical protein